MSMAPSIELFMRLHWKAKVKELNAEYAELLARKKAAYDDEGNADPLQARAGHLEEKGACSRDHRYLSAHPKE